MNLMEAFKALGTLNEDTFSINDDGIEQLSAFENDDDMTDKIAVIDPGAETAEELEDSYVGKVILDCEVCHSKLYKCKEEISINDSSDLANIDMECPYCYSQEGFKIVGEVAPFVNKAENDAEEPVDESLQEGTALLDRPKTVAGILKDHMDELSDIEDVHELRNKVLNIVRNSDASDKPIVVKLTRDLFSKKSIPALLSTIGTYMTGDKVINVAKPQSKKTANESLEEDIQSLEVTTDDTHVTLDSDEGGKVTVATEPINNKSEEAIVSVSDETQAEIKDDKPLEDFEDIDEESFNELGESYLKRIYENVDSFKLTDASATDNKLVLEGCIKFTNGNQKATKFVFESINKNGKRMLLGENVSFSKSDKAFAINGSVEDKKFLSESLRYNYRATNNNGKLTRLYGTVRRG